MRRLNKNSIPRLLNRDALPLSFAQQRLWLLDQLTAGSALYNITMALRLTGALNIPALARSMNMLVQRHETLRSCFRMVAAEPVAILVSSMEIELQVESLETTSAALREEKMLRRLHDEAYRPFDLTQAPLLRVLLIKLCETEHVFVLTIHHIIADGWSMGILKQELSVLYQAALYGTVPVLPELSIQYGDFSAWQRQWLQGEILDRQFDYWKQQLAAVPIMELPTDHPRGVAQSYRGANFAFSLPKSLADALHQFSQQQGATLFMTLLSAFQVLLHRYTNQDDIVVGTPIAGRNQLQTEGLIGFFVNTLVLRTDVSANPSFVELLSHTRERVLDAFTHQDLPFEQLVSVLAPQRNLNHNPLFQIMFILQNTPDSELNLCGLDISPLLLESNTAKFDLTLSLTEAHGGIAGMIEYSTDLFDAPTITRMALHLQVLLEGILVYPQARLSDLPMLGMAERQQLLTEWNDTASDYPRLLCVHQLFEAQASRTPDAVAVVHDDQTLTYSELNARANQIAHFLRIKGVVPDVRVAIAMERSFDMLAGILGILKAGGAYVPLDLDYPAEHLAFMLADTQALVLLTQHKFSHKFSGFTGFMLSLDSYSASAEHNLVNVSAAHDLAYIIYTSGSTGKAKGVAVPHQAIVRLLFGVDYVRLGAEESILMMAPVAFDASTFEIWAALLHGGRCVLYPDSKLNLARLGSILSKYRVSILWLTSTLFNMVINEAPQILFGVKQLLIGGEALSAPHVRSALKLLPNTQIINGYGPTESTTFACSYKIPRQQDENRQSVPIGRPIANTLVYILDRHLNLAPVGVVGELYIGGDGLALGYHNRPELTAEKFIANPFSRDSGARLYKTGDRVRYAVDGNIEFLGRIDNQVKIRGFRIELEEIEAALEQHPDVLNAVAQVRNTDSGGKMLIVLVVKRKPIMLQALRDFLKRQLPAYLVPDQLFFINQLSHSANGKLDRAKLQNLALPEFLEDSRYQAPFNFLQNNLLQIWSDLLKNNRIGINDNFFDLGGDSLNAVIMHYRIEKLIDWSVPLTTIYHNPTVKSLAEAMLLHKGKKHNSPLIQIQAGAAQPPFIFMHGDFHGGGYYCHQLAREMGAEQSFYAIQPHGLPGRSRPSTIEAMAAEYLVHIRAQFPEGPYFLGGHCNGALVAFEIAQRLLELGSKVGLLVMMDPTHAYGNNAAPVSEAQPQAMDLDKLSPEVRHNTVMRLYRDICERYEPKFYPGKLTLFMANDNLKVPLSVNGWEKMATTIEAYAVPGNHVSMLTLHSAVLSKILLECRDKVKWN